MLTRLLISQSLKRARITLKAKIWMAVTSIVLLFSFFVLFYLPAIQEKYLLSNFNKEVQNHANTVALGVKIAMTEQNFQGVQTAMDFVKKDPLLQSVSLLQIDTVWNDIHSKYSVSRSVFKTYPERKRINIDAESSDSVVIKRAAFSTPIMKGEIVIASSTREIIQSKKQIRITSLLFSFLVFSIGILIGFFLAKNISVPVLELRDAATRVGRGDLTQRVFNKSRDEIGELGIAFNKMVIDLSVARKEVEDRTRELVIEKKKSDELLEDLKKTLIDLKATQEQLIRQEKLASIGQLTKGLVDRLLNPLNYVTNFATLSIELLKEGREILNGNNHATDDYIREELLPLFGMIESNTEKIEEHSFSLTRIVRSMDKLLKAKSDTFIEVAVNSYVESQFLKYKKEQINTNISFELVKGIDYKNSFVRILPVEMNSVFISLFNNAIYSLREKLLVDKDFESSITIETFFYDSYVEIKMRDNGKGISDVDKKQLFSPFFTTKPTSEGTGLGLFISQDIIRAHKGIISVDTKQGSFTAFTIRLPISASTT